MYDIGPLVELRIALSRYSFQNKLTAHLSLLDIRCRNSYSKYNVTVVLLCHNSAIIVISDQGAGTYMSSAPGVVSTGHNVGTQVWGHKSLNLRLATGDAKLYISSYEDLGSPSPRGRQAGVPRQLCPKHLELVGCPRY